VELRGFEPLTFCMPCLRVSSGDVSLGHVGHVRAMVLSGGVWLHLLWPGGVVTWFVTAPTGLFRAPRTLGSSTPTEN
jgi:hypothetical protein